MRRCARSFEATADLNGESIIPVASAYVISYSSLLKSPRLGVEHSRRWREGDFCGDVVVRLKSVSELMMLSK